MNHGKRDSGRYRTNLAAIGHLKAVCLTVFLAAMLVAPARAVGQTLLPGLRAPLLETPSLPSVLRNKMTLDPNSAGSGINDAELQELARGLKYEPGLMYKFVHDHIHFTPMWGEVKGPYMTWMDRSGNDFDQASLMIALLKHAAQYGTGHTITNIKYVIGEIELTAAQFTSWFDTEDNPDMAKRVLARAGLYGEVTTSDSYIGVVRLEHVWVEATIDGTVYKIDPSFKSHQHEYGLNSLNEKIGYSYTPFYEDANEGATVTDNSAKDINRANIEQNLTTYTTALINEIKANHNGEDLLDIVGGARIEPVQEATMPPTTLPYTVRYRDQEFAYESIPDLYRTTLRIQHCGINQTLKSSETYGRRLSLKYNASNQPQLVLDGTVKATGTTTTPGTSYDLTLTVDHPYEVSDFDGTVVIQVTAGGFYHIVNGWGDTDTKILLKHRDLLQQYRSDGLSDSSEQVLGESFSLIGMTWLAQTSRMRFMAAGVTDSAVVNHHMLGVTGQYGAPYINIPLGHLGITRESTSTDIERTFLAISGHAAAYEHAVIRQLQDCNAVSTVRLMKMANDRTTDDRIFVAGPYTWAGIQPQLAAYSPAEVNQITAYINAGFFACMPEYGDLTEEDWTGMAFEASLLSGTTLTSAHVVGSGYKGGIASDNASISPVEVVDYGYGATEGLDGEGAYTTGATDIAIGSGGLPYGVAFGRQYASNRRLEDGPLGRGWSHNLDISALVRSDSFRVLGDGSPLEAAMQIVTLYVTEDVLHWTTGPEKQVIVALCENWLMDQMFHNVVIMKQGAGRIPFVKRPDTGTKYLPPPGQNLGLVKYEGNWRVKNTSGIFYDFDSEGRLDNWTDAFGNKVQFTYTSGKLSQVACKLVPASGGDPVVARTLSFTYTGNRITSVTDSASRSISYTYDAYGNLTRYTNPDANNTNYEYDANTPGLMTRIYSPVDVVNPFVRIVYDSLGRMKQIIDANSCTWDFYRATYRTEALPPAQLDPNNQVKRYGTVSWANPDNRTVTSIDALGRKTTSTFDGQFRPTSTTTPAGTSSELAYNPENNVVQADSFSIPGSGDPNVLKQYDYCFDGTRDDTNPWFVHMMQQTDTTSKTAYYYYDYNEPQNDPNHGHLGKLLRIVYPQVDPPTDVNQPRVWFTYYANGQLHTQTDPNHLVTHFEYYPSDEGAGLKKTVIDPNNLNITTEVTYDSVGRVATTKDPLGNVTTNQYYASGRLRKVISPAPFNYETVYEYYEDAKLKHVKQLIPGGTGGNDFASDPNCVALWRFEPNNLTTDSISTNTLTNYGATVNSTTYREGAAAADFQQSSQQYLSITDAALASGFPLKNGDTNKKISVSFWFRLKTVTQQYLWAKVGDTGTSLGLYIGSSSGTYRVILIKGNSSDTNSETAPLTTLDLSASQWYHVGLTYDDTNRSYRLRVYDATADAVFERPGTFNNNIRINQGDLALGRRPISTVYFADAQLDECAVFNDILTAAEIDEIRQATYGSASAQHWVYLQSLTYNSRGLKATSRGPYPEDPTADELQVNYTQYTYDALGRLTDVNDAENHVTTTRYYPDGKVWKVIDAEGHETVTNTYNPDGSLKEVRDAKGNVTKYEYNGFMGSKRTIYPDDTFEEPGYDLYRRLIRNTTRKGEFIEFTYDGLSRVKTKTTKTADESVVNTITYKYDITGKLIRTTDNTGTIKNIYDKVGRVRRVEYPDSRTIQYQYDAAGRRTRLTYPDATYITYEYDELGRLTKIRNSSGTVLAQYTYDARSRRTALDYANGAGTDYSYDTASRLLTIDNQTVSGQHKYSYTYDNVGNRTTMLVTDGSGTKTHVYSYDNIYQLTDVNYPTGYDYLATDTTFNYDAAGNRTTVIDGSGTTTYTTNNLNQYSAVAGTSYNYDNSGNMTYDGDGLMYGYDPENRLITASKVNGSLAAACDARLAFTTGGDASWSAVMDEYSPGNDRDAVRSGAIGDSQSTWLEAKVNGKGTLTYWRKVSSQSGDTLKLYIDGVCVSTKSGTVNWEQASESITTVGTHTLRWTYSKDASGSAGSDCAWIDCVRWEKNSSWVPLQEALDTSAYMETGPTGTWIKSTSTYYYDNDSACGGNILNNASMQMEATVDGERTISFYWKVSSQANCDWLEFYIDGVRQDRISGEVDWQQKTYSTTGLGPHSLLWQYIKDGSGSSGSDCGWVDYLQGAGGQSASSPTEWDQVSYTYDPAGRRIEKKYDGSTVMKYLYDGDNCIAEYDGAGSLLRKYIFGPGVDQAISMIDVEHASATYYYHFDGLGSVIALTNSSGSAVELYEYSVYGQVAASDANIPNRFMFTGREFDADTGLYYYRARYYNPEIGRFLQTDPIGYGDGMNWYAYCRNGPTYSTDPFGLYQFFLVYDGRSAPPGETGAPCGESPGWSLITPTACGEEWTFEGLEVRLRLNTNEELIKHTFNFGLDTITVYTIVGGSSWWPDPGVDIKEPLLQHLSESDKLIQLVYSLIWYDLLTPSESSITDLIPKEGTTTYNNHAIGDWIIAQLMPDEDWTIDKAAECLFNIKSPTGVPNPFTWILTHPTDCACSDLGPIDKQVCEEESQKRAREAEEAKQRQDEATWRLFWGSRLTPVSPI